MNKSLEIMRKAGLKRAVAFTDEDIEKAKKSVEAAFGECEARSEATAKALYESYQLGLRGIKIGDEELYQ